MNNKQEGFQQNVLDIYEFVNIDPLLKSHITSRPLLNKNKLKMTFKSPLTIFNHTNLTLSPDDYFNTQQQIQSQSKTIDQIPDQTSTPSTLCPLEKIVYKDEKYTDNSLNQTARLILQKPSDVFPKRFVCTFNKFHQNVFLKNDLTLVVKNISKLIKLELLKSIEQQFDFFINDQKKQKYAQEKLKLTTTLEKNTLQKKYKQHQSQNNLRIHQEKILPKKGSALTFNLQKSLILNSEYKQKNSQIQFFSDFQSGNLHLAFKDKNIENLFYLFLTNDVNTHGFNQWFYFGIDFCGKQSKTFRFIIVNISKQFKFDSNMKLLTLKKGKWGRQTPFIVYKNKYSKYNGGNLMSLDFEYNFQSQTKQPIFFALSHPYTYSRVLKMLKQIKSNVFVNLVVSVESLGKTELTNYIPFIKIQKITLKKSYNSHRKPIILIMARQHAGETPSSFICQSLIKSILLQNSQQMILLDKYKFVIIPMANPDGVIHGNSRTNIKGYDINRLWQINKFPSMTMSQQTDSINTFIHNLVRQNSIEYAIDLHSHSKQFGSFVYCCDNNQTTKLFNYYFTVKSPQCVYQKCKVNLTSDKKCTFRGQMYTRLNIKNSFTIQTSFYGYKSKGEAQSANIVPFSIKNYQNIAHSILFALTQIQKTKSKSQERYQVYKVIQQIDLKIRQSEKLNKQKTKQNDNQSDSDPQNQYLGIKQRQQNGEKVSSINQKLKQDQNLKQTNNLPIQSRNKSFTPLNRSIQIMSKIQCTFQHTSIDSKAKRKKIYSNKEQRLRKNSTQLSNQIGQNHLRKKYPAQAQKQLDFRKTLRRGFRMSQSQNNFYKPFYSKRKVTEQRQQHKTFIVYPTECDVRIGYDSIRILHENLFRGTIKVKSIKQQSRILKRIHKDSRSNSFMDTHYNNFSNQTFNRNNIVKQSAKPIHQFLSVQKIKKIN